MFQSFTKIFSKPKPEFSRSKILSFIENYDYLKGRKDPGATGLITVLSESECRVNLKNDVNSLDSLDNLLDLVRAITYLGVKITNEDEVRKWVRSFLKSGLIEAYYKDPFDETRDAVRIEEIIGNIFSPPERDFIREYYKNILFSVMREKKPAIDSSVIYVMNTCVLTLKSLSYKFTSEEQQEILRELMNYRKGEIAFCSYSLKDRNGALHPDRESEDAYNIIEALDEKMGLEYRRKFVQSQYRKGIFYSLMEEIRKSQEMMPGRLSMFQFGYLADYRKVEDSIKDDEIIQNIFNNYDQKTGGFYYLGPELRKRGRPEDREPTLKATFIALYILHKLLYQFQS